MVADRAIKSLQATVSDMLAEARRVRDGQLASVLARIAWDLNALVQAVKTDLDAVDEMIEDGQIKRCRECGVLWSVRDLSQETCPDCVHQFALQPERSRG